MTGHTDCLFITTEKEQWCLIQYAGGMVPDNHPEGTVASTPPYHHPHQLTGTIKTIQYGDLHDRAFRPIEKGLLLASTPNLVVLHMVQGLVKVLFGGARRGQGHFREPLNCRIEELQVLDMVLLVEETKSESAGINEDPLLVLLSEAYGGARFLSTYRVREKGLVPGPWKLDKLEMDAHRLIGVPAPRGGILVLSDASIIYYNHQQKIRLAVALRPTRITCYCPVDTEGFRYLLGDADGRLYVLFLFSSPATTPTPSSSPIIVESLKLEFLGNVCIPTTLTYLDNGYVLVGSRTGDSQVVRLLRQRQAGNESLVEVVETFQSLAPLIDFVVSDLERMGQSSVVAASGAFKEGSIRIVRQGSNLQTALEIITETNEWPSLGPIHDLYTISLMPSTAIASSELYWYFLLSSPFGTCTFGVEQGKGADQVQKVTDSLSLVSNEPTLWAGCVGGLVIQVTPSAIIYWPQESFTTGQNRQEWQSQLKGGRLSHVAVKGPILVVADAAHRQLWIFEVLSNDKGTAVPSLTHRNHLLLSDEISSIALVIEDGALSLKGLIIAFWPPTSTTMLGWLNLTSNELQPLDIENSLGSDRVDAKESALLIRSIAIYSTAEGMVYLLWGTGDGHLFHGQIIDGSGDRPTIMNIQRATLGQQPIRLISVCPTKGVPTLLFAISNRPFLVTTSRAGRLMFRLTNLKEGVVAMASYPDFHLINAKENDECHILVVSEEGQIQGMSLEKEGRRISSSCSTSLTLSSESFLHHQIHHMGCTITRIIQWPAAHAFVVLCLEGHFPYELVGIGDDEGDQRGKPVKSIIKLLDQDSLTILDTYELPRGERAHSLTLVYLITQNQNALVVGTAQLPERRGEEPQAGRLLTFVIDQTQSGSSSGGRRPRLQLLHQLLVPGCVYAMVPVDGKLVATVNGMTNLYRWGSLTTGIKSGNMTTNPSNTISRSASQTSGGENLVLGDADTAHRNTPNPSNVMGWNLLHSHFGQILGIKLDGAGTMVAVGDLMKSVCLLTVTGGGDRLQEVARDYEPLWMTEVHLLEEGGRVLGADNLGNLFVMGTERDDHFTPPRSRLAIRAGFHLGEVVNCIRKGTLARDLDSTNIHFGSVKKSIISEPNLIATTTGAIYFFGRIEEGKKGVVRALRILEGNLQRIIQPVGQLGHQTWRQMINERKQPTSMTLDKNSNNRGDNDGGETILDGDLIARFLELTAEQQRVVAEGDEKVFQRLEEKEVNATCTSTGLTVTDLRELVESLVSAH